MYSRDKRSPKPKNDFVSKVMSANKAKDTKPELTLRKELWKNEIKGYRLNSKKLPGKPDIAFFSKKTAIFVNGCFWHRCPFCNLATPRNNRFFWKNKFDTNKLRDQKKELILKELGWKVITIWECKLKSEMSKIIDNIKVVLQS